MKNCLIVNEPHFIDLVLSIFTQFLKAKMVSRVSNPDAQLIKHVHE